MIENLMGKALLTGNPVERAFYEDQITINLAARKLMRGNHDVIVVDGGEAGMDFFTLDTPCNGGTIADFFDAIRREAESMGYRVIVGSALFTAKDNARKFVAK